MNQIVLGLFLLIVGIGCFTVFISDVAIGYDDEKDILSTDQSDPEHPVLVKRSERFWPLIFLGFISLVPGEMI